jgi:hypothetical protein
MKSHPNFRILLDQALEFLNDGWEILIAAFLDECDLFGEPRFQNSVVPW